MLAIDVGNSRIKWARFVGSELIEFNASSYSYETAGVVVDEMMSCMPVEKSVWISCVANDRVKNILQERLSLNGFESIVFARSQAQQRSVRNAYQPAEKLGVDRWLAMLAGFNDEEHGQNVAVCVVDCGTAITLDTIDAQGVHLGGLILPGYQLMLSSLITAADKLSLPKENDKEKLSELAIDTGQGILNGIRSLLVDGLNAQLQRQQEMVGDELAVYITGGDGEWLSKLLQADVRYDPYLVMKGLELISRQ